MQNLSVALPMFLAAFISLALTIYIGWQASLGRIIRGSAPFMLAMSLVALWALFDAIGIVAEGIEAKIFWAKMAYVPISSMPVAMLAFAARYTAYQRWGGNMIITLLSIFPVITIAIAFTNEAHHWLWEKIFIGPLDLDYVHGPWFLFHLIYSYLLVGMSIYILVRTLFESARQYHRQIAFLLLGIFAPLFLNIFYVINNLLENNSLWTSVDLTSVAFTVTGLFLAWDFFRYGLLDVAPVARDRLIETMSDALLVLDAKNRVADINPSARRILNIEIENTTGRPVTEVLRAWPELLNSYHDATTLQSELTIPINGKKCIFDLHISPLTDRQGRLTGRLMLLHDITDLKEARALAEAEREKSESLLLNILPQDVAAMLKRGDPIIAEHFDSASILFADVVNFTPFSAKLTADELVKLLNEIFTYFDSLVEKYNLEKIKTIGDCYMVAAGVPNPRPDHAQALARFGLDVHAYMASREFMGHKLAFRIGINSGPVVAGVIGRKKFIYDLWGDTVNIASRMESSGLGGSIQITESTRALLDSEFISEPRGIIEIKGKGKMPVWYVTGFR